MVSRARALHVAEKVRPHPICTGLQCVPVTISGMQLSKHLTSSGSRWAADGVLLVHGASLGLLLSVPSTGIASLATSLTTGELATGSLLAPIDDMHEVWACGVTYLRSRDARMAESTQASIYDRVYSAPRPEQFFKAPGWRVVGDGAPIRIRADSKWNVPEPELALVMNRFGEIVGYTAANDVSSRDIEGENPLYLPQAKSYNGACSLGRAIALADPSQMLDLAVEVSIERSNQNVFAGSTSTSQLKRSLGELADYLFMELSHPHGALMMTGTGIVPPESFSLAAGDVVNIRVGSIALTNTVA